MTSPPRFPASPSTNSGSYYSFHPTKVPSAQPKTPNILAGLQAWSCLVSTARAVEDLLPVGALDPFAARRRQGVASLNTSLLL